MYRSQKNSPNKHVDFETDERLQTAPTYRKEKKKYKLAPDEEFVDYKFVEMPDGKIKRKKVFKRIFKSIKIMT